MKDDFLVPKKWKSDIRKSFDTNDKALSRKFDLYAENICKNTGLKNYLSEQQNNKCAWCGESLEDNTKGYSVIHHVDYDNFCTGPTYIWYKNGEEKEVPNCLGCSCKNECTSNLYVVHTECNKHINDVQLRKNREQKEKENNEQLQANITDHEELDNKEVIDQIRNYSVVKKDADACPNIYSDRHYVTLDTSFGKVRVNEKDWYSVKEDSFDLFCDEYTNHTSVFSEPCDKNIFLFSIIKKAKYKGDVLREKGARYYTLETLRKNRDRMIKDFSIDVVEYCKMYNNSQYPGADGILSPTKLPFIYCNIYNTRLCDKCYCYAYEQYPDTGTAMACVYNLHTFDMLPLSLSRGETFEFENIGNKEGQGVIYICKEWYDDPEIKKVFDGYIMTATNTKKILSYPEVLNKHSWIEEYLNPSVV